MGHYKTGSARTGSRADQSPNKRVQMAFPTITGVLETLAFSTQVSNKSHKSVSN